MKRYGDLACLGVALVGVVVLFGWWIESDALRSVIPGAVTMKIGTAVGFVLGGVMMFLIRGNGIGAKSQYLCGACTFGLVADMAMVFLIHLSPGVHFPLLVGHDRPEYSVGPGVPSVGTLAAFLLLEACGLLWIFEQRKPIRYASIAIAGVGVVALLGYVLRAPALFYYVEGRSSAMAVHTAALFVVLGVAGATSPIPRPRASAHGTSLLIS